ncbi:hypothetical protein [Halovulum sp. GXIMD14793]
MKTTILGIALISLGTGLFAQSERVVTPTAFVLREDGKATSFNRDAWLAAVKRSKDYVLHMALFDQAGAFEAAKAAAREHGVPENTVILSTNNATAKNSTEFRSAKEQADQILLVENVDLGWRTAFTIPMCTLYERDAVQKERAPSAILVAMDEDYAQLFCYENTITYFGSGRTEPHYFDGQTITLQETMPPIKIHSAYLAHKDKRDENGRYLQRESNVYAPNEEIFLRAYLENVARE